MKIRFIKKHINAITPERTTDGAAGYDLYVSRKEVKQIPALQYTENIVVTYHSDICVEIPEGYVGLLFPRSSVYKTGQTMANCVGVIDSDYRGEISGVYYSKFSGACCNYLIGERFAQLVVVPHMVLEFEEVNELGETIRGEGGYGSTGI